MSGHCNVRKAWGCKQQGIVSKFSVNVGPAVALLPWCVLWHRTEQTQSVVSFTTALSPLQRNISNLKFPDHLNLQEFPSVRGLMEISDCSSHKNRYLRCQLKFTVGFSAERFCSVWRNLAFGHSVHWLQIVWSYSRKCKWLHFISVLTLDFVIGWVFLVLIKSFFFRAVDIFNFFFFWKISPHPPPKGQNYLDQGWRKH